MIGKFLGGALAAVVIAGAGSAAAATCAPAQMVKVVVRDTSVDPASFAAQPKTIYRAGSTFGRLEEAPDPAQGLHLLSIVSEPDIWFVNQVDHSGQHIVDPGPSLAVHFPLFDQRDPILGELEFGCEAAFVAIHAAKAERKVKIGSERGELYRVTVGDTAVEVVLAKRDRPLQAAYYKAGKLLARYDYLSYETGLKVDEALFQRPDGFTWVERRPGQ
jgi:hypothetical protein